MKKFEYRKLLSPISEDELNALGEDGWELITARCNDYYIFKREKQPQTEGGDNV